MRNTYAHNAQRHSAPEDPDDFPSPRWATRALIEYGLPRRLRADLPDQTCLEPACGRGHMAVTLAEFFGSVTASDLHDYGFGPCRDFLTHRWPPYDWVITNPPYGKVAQQFILRMRRVATVGFAVLERIQFVEGGRRYREIYKPMPPTRIVQFASRVSIQRGRVHPDNNTPVAFAWFIWEIERIGRGTWFDWIPDDARGKLERASDYRVPAPLARAA